MKNAYCIVVSKFKLHQCVALCRSLLKKIRDRDSYNIFVLCMDEDTAHILSELDLDMVTCIPLDNVETDELRRVKESRRLHEYCWTLKPFFLEYIFENFSNIDRAIHLDADLYCFKDPSLIFEKQPECSVLLSDHDFAERYKGLEKDVGKTNSGLVSFKRDENGLASLRWWRDRCLEWCFAWIEDGKFSDQRYLDQVPNLFKNACYINTPGVNIAPWNQANHTISLRDHKVYVGKERLIIYHFCSFHMRNEKDYYVLFNGNNLTPCFYDSYVKVIVEVLSDIKKIDPSFNIFETNKE